MSSTSDPEKRESHKEQRRRLIYARNSSLRTARHSFRRPEMPKIIEPTDAVIRLAATCVCGSDLWPYRGLQPINGPTPMGHEYCGVRRRGRQRGQVHQAGAIRGRLVRHVGQHLSPLPVWLPVFVRSS